MSPVTWQAAALLLDYPDEELYGHRPLLRAAVRDPALLAFLDTLDATPLAELAAHYVETFDRRRRCCLYLTYYRDGDTRRRGASLAELNARYRAAGLPPPAGELPDYLPAVLEFAARTGDPGILAEHRAGLELLRLALQDRGSPYAAPVDAVCGTLPGPPPHVETARLARAGPPREEVGR